MPLHFCPQFTPEYALWGALGGLVPILVREGGYIDLPSFRRVRERWRVKLGVLRFLAVGAVAGCVGDHSPEHAFLCGVASMYVAQLLQDRVEKRAKQMFGKEEDNVRHDG